MVVAGTSGNDAIKVSGGPGGVTVSGLPATVNITGSEPALDRLIIEAGDGERRTFAPGSVLSVTDTQGPGHRTFVVGEQDVFAVWVPIP